MTEKIRNFNTVYSFPNLNSPLKTLKLANLKEKIFFSARNTARRFFERPDIASRILGVPAELIWGVGEIWSTLTSGHFINTELFEEFCEGWLEVYKESSIREENISFQSIFIEQKMVFKAIFLNKQLMNVCHFHH